MVPGGIRKWEEEEWRGVQCAGRRGEAQNILA